MIDKIVPASARIFDQSNKLYGTDSPLVDATALDFWRWALGDLHQNNTRGIFAEWLVAKLLRSTGPCRDPWAECDIVLENGLRVEVKAAAQRQAWHRNGETTSTITFGGLHGKRWSAETGYSRESSYNADIYVFCLLENHKTNVDPFDLRCWRFWVMSRDMLARPTPNSPMRRSITLASLRREGIETMADDLHKSVKNLYSSFNSKE